MNKNRKFKNRSHLRLGGRVKKGFQFYAGLILVISLMFLFAMTGFAADDPVVVVNNFSTFIFGLIRAVGLILLGFGIVQVGLSLKSHFLTVAGGIIITFAKEILNLIVG